MAQAQRSNIIKLDSLDDIPGLPDDFKERSFKRTAEGFLKGVAPVTNIGVFSYNTPEGVVRELRLPEDVFDGDSLRTLALCPVTLSHPQDGVSPETAGELMVGAVGEVWNDPYKVFAQMAIFRQDALDSIQAGVRGLSCGYTCDLEDTQGNWNGVDYDRIQRNIRYNHVALVSVPRAGDTAHIHLDGMDGECVSPMPEHCKDEAKVKAMSPSPEFALNLMKLIGTMFKG